MDSFRALRASVLLAVCILTLRRSLRLCIRASCSVRTQSLLLDTCPSDFLILSYFRPGSPQITQDQRELLLSVQFFQASSKAYEVEQADFSISIAVQ